MYKVSFVLNFFFCSTSLLTWYKKCLSSKLLWTKFVQVVSCCQVIYIKFVYLTFKLKFLLFGCVVIYFFIFLLLAFHRLILFPVTNKNLVEWCFAYPDRVIDSLLFWCLKLLFFQIFHIKTLRFTCLTIKLFLWSHHNNTEILVC